MNELDFYNKAKNWDFSMINSEVENFTNWDMYEELKKYTNPDSKILDLGTGGGEKIIKYFPDVAEIVATDYSEEMVKTANENLAKSDKQNITFKQMDNLNMIVPDNYFDVVVARHTVIDAKGIYKALKQGGKLIVRGVDKEDCWSLKRAFGKGQCYNDVKAISMKDYEDILDAGFKHVELVPIHIKEYYKTKEDLLMLLYKTPILTDFSEEKESNMDISIDMQILDKYIAENTFDKGILLIRRYYGIVGEK